VYWSSLKITHPLASWLFTSLLSAICGLYFIYTGVKVLTTPQGVFVSIGVMFWVGLCIYSVSTLGFLYLKFAARFKRMNAGVENMERLRNFVENYPDIAKELLLDVLLREGATFGQLKKIQKDANRKIVQVASNSIIGRG